MSHADEPIEPSKQPVSPRAEFTIYASGMLTDSQAELIGFLIPLWAVMLGLSPLEIGFLVSAKSLLPGILAIHGGVLMDRYGTRLVMILMGIAGALLPPVFAISTWFPALILLQMAVGTAMSFTWIGAQSLAVEAGKNKPAIVGRFAFFARVGVMIAPIMAGVLWDFVAPWVAFAVIGVVGIAFLIAVRAVPVSEVGAARVDIASRPDFRISHLMPKLSDYIGAAGLLVIPAVAFVVVVSSVRIVSATMQQSFYIIYLEQLGLKATAIGGFLTLSQMMAACGTLLAAHLTRFIPPNWVFLGAVCLSIFFVFSTPLYGDAFFVLAVAIGIRGLCQGISQPVMYRILSNAVRPETQATAIGLRATGNRVANLMLPVFMGAIAQFWGLNATFYVTGTLMLSILAGMGIWVAFGKASPKS